MICHFSAYKRTTYNRTWAPIMNSIAKDMARRGYTLTKDPQLMWWREPDSLNITTGTVEESDIVIYTDFTKDHFQKPGLYVGLSGPEPGSFTIDNVGVWPHLEQTYIDITYLKRDVMLSVTDSNHYWNEYLSLFKESKTNHFNNPDLNPGTNSPSPGELEKDFVLCLIDGNYTDPWDESRWERWKVIINNLLGKNIPVVVKYDPRFLLTSEGKVDPNKLEAQKGVLENLGQHVKVFTGLESLHDIVPQARAVIVEDTNFTLEPLMYLKPILVLGKNPYSHICAKEIVHEHQIIDALENLQWFDKNTVYAWLKWYCTQWICYSDKEESLQARLDDLLQ